MTKKALVGICAGLLAVVIGGGTCAMGYASRNEAGKWFRNSDLATWHWSDKKTKETMSWGAAIDDVGNELNGKTTYAMPEGLAFYAMFNDDLAKNMVAPSVTVTCSHNFEFNNVLVDWSVEYPSGASASDVVTVTPTADGSLTASITCTGEFSEPLTLKATERGNTDNVATCKIDFVKRIKSFQSINIQDNDFGNTGGLDCRVNFTTGTVNGNLKVSEVIYQISNNFQIDVQRYLKFNIKFKYYTAKNLILNADSYETVRYSADGEEWAYEMFIQDFSTYDEAHKNAIKYAWYTAFTNGKYWEQKISNVELNVNFQVIYNGNVIQNYAESDYIGGSSANQLTGEYYGEDLSPDLTLNGNLAV